MTINDESPYIEETIIKKKQRYNPKYGDDRVCRCSHPYYRHFDSYDNMCNVGCKYCPCSVFEEKVNMEDTFSDQQIILLCAQALGYKTKFVSRGGQGRVDVYILRKVPPKSDWKQYDPLTNDTQVVELIKEFKLRIGRGSYSLGEDAENKEVATWEVGFTEAYAEGEDPDFNRAVCLCVASMQWYENNNKKDQKNDANKST